MEARGTINIPVLHYLVDELGNDPSWAPSHQLYRLATLLTCLLIRITLVLPLGLAPRLGPNQGLGRYKLPCAAYTTEGNKASHYLVPNLGYEPRPPKRAGFKPAAYTFRQKGSGPSTWNQTMVRRSSGVCLIIRRYWKNLVPYPRLELGLHKERVSKTRASAVSPAGLYLGASPL